MITIIGLGPAGCDRISMGAYEAIRNAPIVFVRTMKHPAVEDLTKSGIDIKSMDHIYDSSDTFNDVYSRIAETIISESIKSDVVYAVPGHPLIGEISVKKIIDLADNQGTEYKIIGSESFIDASMSSIKLNMDAGLKIIDALSIDTSKPDTDCGNLIYQVYNRNIASDVKLSLMELYPDEMPVKIIIGAGTSEEEIIDLPLFMIDRYDWNHLTTIYIPPIDKHDIKQISADNELNETSGKKFEKLIDIMSALRAENGCPWDREQTHESMRKYLIEETYEAIDAIDRHDADELSKELGDVLLQVIFHAQIGLENKTFTIDDVIDGISEKLIYRHPHVFADGSAENADEVLHKWEQLKKTEKGFETRKSILDGVPKALPALMRAMEISKKAAKAGFEWPDIDSVMKKADEEILELKDELPSGNIENISNEIGDLLFTVVNIARWKNIDPEESLRIMIDRFYSRFTTMEKLAAENNKSLAEMNINDLDILWEQAKIKHKQA